MPLTQLDPVAALVVIDLQKGITSFPTAHPAAEIIAKSAWLAEAFRRRRLPVVLVNVAGGAEGRTDAGWPKRDFPPDWADLVPELRQQPDDLLVTKHCVGAFTGTDLDAKLRQRGVTQIFLTGIATSFGVESTGRVAFDLGYNVVWVADAMTDMNEQSHQARIEKLFPRLGEVETTEGVLAKLG